MRFRLVMPALLISAFAAYCATDVFWYKAIANAYNLTQSNPGPGIPAGAVVHEGIILSSGVAQHTGTSEATFFVGNGINQAGRCGAFWSKDLCEMEGVATSAKIRGEFRDGWSTAAYCNPGPISIRCGVADFQTNIDVWGTPADVSETATWQDFLNPLGSTMGYDMSNPTLMAEQTINYTAPAGRPDQAEPSVLDGEFAEIDVTNQVNWILSHTGANKGSYSGQYAIVFLSSPADPGVGKINLYGYEDCQIGGAASDNPWTKDGNTVHLLAEGDLTVGDAVETGAVTAAQLGVSLGRAMPNPFTASASIVFNTGDRSGVMKIYAPDGRTVFSRQVKGSGVVSWNACDLASGVYLCRLAVGNRAAVSRLILAR